MQFKNIKKSVNSIIVNLLRISLVLCSPGLLAQTSNLVGDWDLEINEGPGRTRIAYLSIEQPSTYVKLSRVPQAVFHLFAAAQDDGEG